MRETVLPPHNIVVSLRNYLRRFLVFSPVASLYLCILGVSFLRGAGFSVEQTATKRDEMDKVFIVLTG